MNTSLMTLENLRTLLGWCAAGNLVLLLLWAMLFLLAHNALLAWHGRWFGLEGKTLNAINYAGMALYKILIWALFIIPYLVLRLAF